MASPQLIRLRWTSHQGTILSLFDALLSNESLVDVTLAAEGKYLKAHKVILASCSPFFQELLSSHHGEKHAIVFLKDVKYSHLQALINYMYRGEVNILQAELQSLLAVAESLQIRGLSERSLNNDPSVLATSLFPGGGSTGVGGNCNNQSKETIILPPIDVTPCSKPLPVCSTSTCNSVATIAVSQVPCTTSTSNNANTANEHKKSVGQPQVSPLSSQKHTRTIANINTSSRSEVTSPPNSSTVTISPIVPVRLFNFTTKPPSSEDNNKPPGPNKPSQSPAKRVRIDAGPIFRQPSATTNTNSLNSTTTLSTSTASSTFHSNSNSNQNDSSKPRHCPAILPVPVEIPSFEIIPKAESPMVVNIDDDDDEEENIDSKAINDNSQSDAWNFETTGVIDTEESDNGPTDVFNQSTDHGGDGLNCHDPGINYDPSMMDNSLNVGDGPSMHQCPTCLKLYQVKGSLLRHLKYECQKPPRFQCDYCGIRFRHGFRLASHKNICKLKP